MVHELYINTIPKGNWYKNKKLKWVYTITYVDQTLPFK